LKESRSNNISSVRRVGKSKTDGQEVLDAKEKETMAKLDTLRKWQEEYCGSCKHEHDLLTQERKY
jgi:hypothetical protein